MKTRLQIEKLKQMCLTMPLSNHNRQASCTSALVVSENGAPFFPHPYLAGQPSLGTSMPHLLVMYLFDRNVMVVITTDIESYCSFAVKEDKTLVLY